jgi:pyridoxine 5-phosphate synthase
MKLGVNIDHIAVLREARRVNSPNILQAIFVCEEAGADQITIHLREDRRHINDFDVKNIITHSPLKVNLECSLNDDIIDIVVKSKPYMATIVPEKRAELTTEGGLDISHKNEARLKKTIAKLQNEGIKVSLFIDSKPKTIKYLKNYNIKNIEFHTGHYCNIYAMVYSNLNHCPHSIKKLELSKKELELKLKNSLKELKNGASKVYDMGIKVAMGHGLNYFNMKDILKIKNISELNIGQSIIARSVFVGLKQAIKEMQKLIKINIKK